MQLKKSFRKGCQMFAADMEEETKDKVASIEDHLVLRDLNMFLEEFHNCHQRETLISLLTWC
jgi:hypothetical protein